MFVEMPPKTGPVAIVSQSGAMSVVPYGLLMSRGVGIRHCHATGNEADLSVSDFAYAIAKDDPEVKLLLLYLEAIANPERLAQAAAGGLGHAELLALLITDEHTRRDTAGLARRLAAAHFEATCAIEDFDFGYNPQIPPESSATWPASAS